MPMTRRRSASTIPSCGEAPTCRISAPAREPRSPIRAAGAWWQRRPRPPPPRASRRKRAADVVSGAAELEGLATGGYAMLADQHLPDDDLASLVSTLEAGMATDPAPVAMLAQSSGTAADVIAGYVAFGDGVQAAVDQRADDLEADAGVRRLVMLALAAAAAVGAVAAGILLAVLLQRRVAARAAG